MTCTLALAGLALAACTAAQPCPPTGTKRTFADRYIDYPAYEGVDIYRLIRTTRSGEVIPLATFDATAGRKYSPGYNKAACEKAARTMPSDDDYGFTYHCEMVELDRE